MSSPRAAALIAALACLLVAGRAHAQRVGFDPAATYAVPVDDSPRRGPADAPITIVEFSDFACRYCNNAQATIGQLDRLYPGQIRWVFRQYPLDDEDGTLAAEAALAAAAQGRFWPMHDRLFAVHGRVDRVAVELIAAELGLDLVRFRTDLDTGARRPDVARDVAVGHRLGISGTPMFFVNGRPVHGNQPSTVFTLIIDDELANAAAAVKAGVAPRAVYEHVVAGGHGTASSPPGLQPDEHPLDPGLTYRVGLGLDGHSDGPADALITVIEWSDFQCHYCARNEPTLARLRAEYPDQVRIIYRHLPLVFHAHADLAAEASVAAAAQGKFWPMHARIFSHQDRLTRADLEEDARAIGLDLPRFRAALDDRRYREVVAADAAAAAALGIDGTPTMFVNGSPIVGAVPWDRLRLVVETKLAQARQMVAGGVAPADVYGVIMIGADAAERGDPSRMPVAGSIHALELGAIDREAAVVAACKGRDRPRAQKLADKLRGEHRDVARGQCAAYGVDLP